MLTAAEVSLVETGATHALLVEPDVRVAAVRLDGDPRPARLEHASDADHEAVEVVDVVEHVDAEHDCSPSIERRLAEVDALEA